MILYLTCAPGQSLIKDAAKHTKMLPSITNGQFRIGSSPIHGLNGVHGIRILNNSKAKDEERNCPSLPLISEGSFTSLVSRRSGKTSPNGKGSEKGNDQASELVFTKEKSRTTLISK